MMTEETKLLLEKLNEEEELVKQFLNTDSKAAAFKLAMKISKQVDYELSIEEIENAIEILKVKIKNQEKQNNKDTGKENEDDILFLIDLFEKYVE
ncbi:MAG: hypothetical protein GX287_07510 [Fusobacteria bacterium]|nr:hypothetical protein [Fusobacteriota bacterium]